MEEMTLNSNHIPVLLKEILSFIPKTKPTTIVDATINGGGHSLAIAENLQENDSLIGIDQDRSALEISKNKLSKAKCQVSLIHGNFENIKELISENNLSEPDFILMDLGWSQNQINNKDRGFSFLIDGPLDMRLDQEKDIPTAKDLVNHLTENDLYEIIKHLGEEQFARKISRQIVSHRQEKPFETTLELANCIAENTPKKRIHPATKTFQALRIAVNNELSVLEIGLEKSFEILNKKGILAVISFHSLEDRIVKRFFQNKKDYGKILTKKPIIATEKEQKENPRSRSAKLRIIEKI